MANQISKIQIQIMNAISQMPKGQFVGVREYTNNNGEVANHIVQANFSYAKAKKNDYEVKLQGINENDVKNVVFSLNKDSFFVDAPTTTEEVENTVKTMLDGYFNPKKRTEKQENCYTYIEDTTLKIHNETKEVHMYALTVPDCKEILIEGNYGKPKNSYRKTRIQNSIKKYLSFTTLKFRQFVVSPEKLSKVNFSGETYQLV